MNRTPVHSLRVHCTMSPHPRVQTTLPHPVSQALWTALETELGHVASEHAAEVQRLYDRCESALRAAEAAATMQRERSPSDGCGVQHNPLFDHIADGKSEDGSVAGRSSSSGDDNGSEDGADADDEKHATELASVRAACEARLAAAQEEIDIKSARLAELEVRGIRMLLSPMGSVLSLLHVEFCMMSV